MTEPATDGPVPELPALVGFDEFAAEFRRRAVTEQRVGSALASLSRRELRFGPYSVSPLARLEASGTLGTPQVRIADAAVPTFRVTVPATLDVSIRLGALSRVAADLEIDLLLTPVLSDDLFLFIDAAPVAARDVRITFRGKGLGIAVSGVVGGLPSAVTDEVRRQVAKQISNALDGSSLRRARTIDIASRIDGTERRRAPDTLTPIGDEEFGRQFVGRAVSIERVSNGFGSLTGQALSIGPLKVGPGGIASARADGTVDVPTVSPDGGPEPGFAITLPLRLDLVVDLAREHRFHADVIAQLRAVPRPAEQLQIVIDIPPLTAADVAVTMQAADNLAGMLGRAGKIDEQIARAGAPHRQRPHRVLAAPGRRRRRDHQRPVRHAAAAETATPAVADRRLNEVETGRTSAPGEVRAWLSCPSGAPSPTSPIRTRTPSRCTTRPARSHAANCTAGPTRWPAG